MKEFLPENHRYFQQCLCAWNPTVNNVKFTFIYHYATIECLKYAGIMYVYDLLLVMHTENQ